MPGLNLLHIVIASLVPLPHRFTHFAPVVKHQYKIEADATVLITCYKLSESLHSSVPFHEKLPYTFFAVGLAFAATSAQAQANISCGPWVGDNLVAATFNSL